MTFDSSTLCARTAAGDAELTVPALGLSLGQRRVLSLLQDPSAFDELAQKHHLEPVKLARDLARLSDLHLVVLQGASARAPAPSPARMTPPAATPDPAEMAAVVIGHGTRRTPALAFAAGTLALLIATGIWYGARSRDTPSVHVAQTEVAPPMPTAAPIGAPALPPAPAPATKEAVTDSVPAATAMILRGNTAPQDRREIRAVPAPLAGNAPAPVTISTPVPTPRAAPSSAAPMAAPSSAAPMAAPPSAAPMAPPSAAPVAVPVAVPVSIPVAAPIASPAAAPVAAEPPPPVQLAAANLAPTPRAAPVPLKAISRDPPEFPKEAIADGLKSGIVTARLHVNARGSVTGVDILAAQPPHVFDRAVRRALIHWQFEPPAAGATADVDVDVKFQRD
jgi:periplasmic protein TonB